ncbi:MAG: hypothetical protein U0974_07760 [Gemmatimonadales bacterium]|nr:hypothetical protein [Gemmatimonadales bacterium]MDZ4389609.1 hypothetical protein [Gemmatimonadales bacterium]
MRGSLILGLLLIAIGGVVMVRGGTFTSQRNVLEVGDLKITADEKQTIPPWVGMISIVIGIGVIAVGARKRA